MCAGARRCRTTADSGCSSSLRPLPSGCCRTATAPTSGLLSSWDSTQVSAACRRADRLWKSLHSCTLTHPPVKPHKHKYNAGAHANANLYMRIHTHTLTHPLSYQATKTITRTHARARAHIHACIYTRTYAHRHRD